MALRYVMYIWTAGAGCPAAGLGCCRDGGVRYAVCFMPLAHCERAKSAVYDCLVLIRHKLNKCVEKLDMPTPFYVENSRDKLPVKMLMQK